METLKKIVIWYSMRGGGDGSAYPKWFLTEDAAEADQESLEEGWGESCTGSVETFEGSDIHREALSNINEED
jgi:hypothetical protein